jgi:cell division protein FtsI/penicillin-binding protein 2
MQKLAQSRWLAALLVWALAGTPALSGQAAKPSAAKPKSTATAKPAVSKKKPAKKPNTLTRNGIPTYIDPTENDIAEFDDPVVREAAVKALGRVNGTVVVVDPDSGRILSIVNQRTAFGGGFQPCSTFKPVVGLAALNEGIITRDTMIKVSRRGYMNLTEALARSNNPYFEILGRQMGFSKVHEFGRMFGLGEQAGLNIFEEHPGLLPATAPEWGGVGKMSSFGEGILMTPLQLAAMGVALSNGGTLYYLQYPRNEEERVNFTPRVKRKLDIEPMLPELREGMMAAVLYGSGHRSFDPYGETLFGKTGTCSDQGSRLGWFLAYSETSKPRMVVSVLLRGHSRRAISGPTAAQIAGRVFRNLRDRSYFAAQNSSYTAAAGSTNPQ